MRPVRLATSPPARRTYLGTFLFLATSFILLCIAVLAYSVFYYNYVPQKLVSVPIHLQYKYGRKHLPLYLKLGVTDVLTCSQYWTESIWHRGSGLFSGDGAGI